MTNLILFSLGAFFILFELFQMLVIKNHIKYEYDVETALKNNTFNFSTFNILYIFINVIYNAWLIIVVSRFQEQLFWIVLSTYLITIFIKAIMFKHNDIFMDKSSFVSYIFNIVWICLLSHICYIIL